MGPAKSQISEYFNLNYFTYSYMWIRVHKEPGITRERRETIQTMFHKIGLIYIQ